MADFDHANRMARVTTPIMTRRDHFELGRNGERQIESPYYNDVPETRGVARNKGNFGGQSGRDMADRENIPADRPAHPYSPGCLHCTRA